MADNYEKKPKGGFFKGISWLYILLFIGFGYILLKDDDTSLQATASYTEFKEYVNKGYVSELVVYSNLNSVDMYIKPDSAKYRYVRYRTCGYNPWDDQSTCNDCANG